MRFLLPHAMNCHAKTVFTNGYTDGNWVETQVTGGCGERLSFAYSPDGRTLTLGTMSRTRRLRFRGPFCGEKPKWDSEHPYLYHSTAVLTQEGKENGGAPIGKSSFAR